MGKGVGKRIGWFLIQTPPGARLGLGTQRRYEALGVPWVKITENTNAVINITLVRLPPQE